MLLLHGLVKLPIVLGRIAQLGERQLDKLDVVGSSPIVPILAE